MKERDSAQNERTFFGPPTPLKDLGITLEKDRLNISEADTLISRTQLPSGESYYQAIILHPLAGEHLAQFLSEAAPFKQARREDILGDLNIKRQAEYTGTFGDEARRLYTLHENDPVIGPEFIRFMNSPEYKRLRAAFSARSADNVTVAAKTLTVLSDRKSHESQYKSAFDQICKSLDKEGLKRLSTQMYMYNQSRNLYVAYLRAIGIGGEWNMEKASLETQADVLRDYFWGLSDNQQEEIIESTRRSETVVYLHEGNVKYSYDFNNRLDKPTFRLTGEDTFEFVNPKGAWVRIKVGPDLDKDWEITDYQFPPDYLRKAIYPVIAWQNRSGKRVFSSQLDVDRRIASQFSRAHFGDVKLGQALAAYFSPKVTEEWASEMTLKGGTRPQRMFAAQMLIWPIINSGEVKHAEDLLNSSDSIIPTLEEEIDRKTK